MRLLILYEKRSLVELLTKQYGKDEAMVIIKSLRALRMPQVFYNLLADALSSENGAVKYGEELAKWDHLVNTKLNLLKK